ncbi:serine acetyltransferase [Nonlabens sp. YIK11]|uniref:serine O-acetyltransferase n=1 Tax=Nonlabens sp. YIK11 TaxID=1453349 RepID=UPI0006DD33E4|nr:serine O-acetyltransferase [Nonlabens sp. YIK11]KQC34649.1 serine acetyltransferase [Nonlabens sp. YIK11]
MKFSSDIKRYTDYSGKSKLLMLLTQQGLWALFYYRIFNAVHKAQLPKLLKRILLIVGVLCQKKVEIFTGISLPHSAQIGEGLYIGHHSGIIVHPQAVIGNNCNISQGVTIGVSGRGQYRGVPVIGDRVYVGANAVVAGNIQVGDGVVIGANSLVVKSVETNTTVVGVPAVKISDHDSQDYIL